nr:hypothetical protein [uncultured Mucilaginibacter sp.]
MTRLIICSLLAAKILSSGLLQRDFSEKKANANSNQDTVQNLRLTGALYKGTTYLLYDIRNIESGTRKVEITVKGKVKQAIELPNQDDYNGFAVNSLKAESKGFALSIEYGSRIYYTKVFHFTYKNNFFWLDKISALSFDKEHPQKIKKQVKNIGLQGEIKTLFLKNYLTD